jgi:predicted Zn-dependent peptidase
VGAVINFEVENFRVKFYAKFLRENTDMILELLAEQLREPLLSDFETVKKRLIGDLEKAKQKTARTALSHFRQSIYPPNHPNYLRTSDTEIEEANSVTLGS